MSVEESNKNQENQSTEKAESTARQETAVVVATPPNNLAHEEQTKMQQHAVTEIQKLGQDLNDWNQVEAISRVGSEAQVSCSEEIALLDRKIGPLIDVKSGPGTQVENSMVQMYKSLDEINPHSLMQSPKSFIRKMLWKTPKIGDVLAKIALKHSTVKSQVVDIKVSLINGKDMLDRNSADLKTLFGNVRERQLQVQKNAYLGELLLNELMKLREQTADPAENARIREIIADVTARVQTMRVMEQQNEQFFVTLSMTVNNNRRLGETVLNTITMAENCVTVALAAMAALHDQQKIAKADREVRDQLGKMMVQTAETVRTQTIEIAKQHTDPAMSMEHIKTAYTKLSEAMNSYSVAQEEGIKLGQKNIQELKAMSQEMSAKSAGLVATVEDPSKRTLEA